MLRLSFLLFSFSVFTLLLCRDSIDNLKKINEMNLLFPHIYENMESRQIEYKLIAYNGCYEWLSSNQNFFNIQGIPDETNPKCQSSAIISLIKSKPITQAIWILAKDKGNVFFKFMMKSLMVLKYWFFLETGDVLKVEAKIAEIAKIEIITKSRILDVGDMQALEVVGYDKDGNMFSTLEGVKIEWAVSKCDHILELASIRVYQNKIFFFYSIGIF